MSVPRRLAGPPRVARSTRGSRERTLDEKSRVHARELGFEPDLSPLFLGLATLVVLVVLGFELAGLAGATAGMALLPVSVLVLRRFRQGQLAHRAQAQLPDVCTHLSRTIRSGRPIEEALQNVACEMTLLPAGLSGAAGQSMSGRPIVAAIEEWAASAESSAEQLLSSALLVGVRQGGDLSNALDLVGAGLRDDLELASRRRVLLIQATMSAAVLLLLPVGFAVVSSVVRGALVFQGRLGAVLVIVGIGLDAVGCLWMRALMRGLR